MKKTIFIFIFALGIQQGLVAMLEETVVTQQNDISEQELQEQLQKMENDMKEANEYHNLEQSFKTLEEEKAQEAEDILKSIEQELNQAEEQASSLPNQEQPETFEAVEKEIINEPALQENVEKAQEKIENIELE